MNFKPQKINVDDLKPCSKCKSTHQHFRQRFLGAGRKKWWINCVCGNYTPAFDTLEDAIEYWNRKEKRENAKV